MTGGQAGEPTLVEVRAQYPAWRCAQGISGLYYAQHSVTGNQVTGEDPLDLRDQIKAAEAREAYATGQLRRDHPGAHEVAVKALEDLEAQLDKRDHDARLVTDQGPVPFLAVANRHAQLGEDIFVDGQSYFWPWGQPIAAIGNPSAAAEKVRYVLAAPGHSHG